MAIKHKGTITLETEQLVLRRFKMDDLESYYRNCLSDHDVWKWSSYSPMTCIEDAVENEKLFTEKWFNQYENLDFYNWAIQLKESDEVIGRIRGWHPDDSARQVELVYEIGQKWWNKGYVTESVKELIRFFFNDVGFNRIFAQHAHENPASGRVMQKCGMIYEGTMRQACKCNNGLFDNVNYAILAEDYCNQANEQNFVHITTASFSSSL